MAKPKLLPYPTNIEEFQNAMQNLFPEEQLVQARGWANMFVEKGLMPAAEDMWLLRQCMRYMPPEIAVNYMSMNLGHQKPHQIESFWVGAPPDWEGAVRMMESAFSVAGWRAVMFPAVTPAYSAEQAARILRLIQQSSESEREINLKTRESVFLEAFEERAKKTQGILYWQEPQVWLNGHKLKPQDQLTIWCAYALLADPDILLKVSKGLRWKGWEVGEYLLDWDKVTSSKYSERLDAAEQLLNAHNKKSTKAALPKDIDWTIEL